MKKNRRNPGDVGGLRPTWGKGYCPILVKRKKIFTGRLKGRELLTKGGGLSTFRADCTLSEKKKEG